MDAKKSTTTVITTSLRQPSFSNQSSNAHTTTASLSTMAASEYVDRFFQKFALTASPRHLATYLLIHCLFSISFLVFLNSSLSFVITDRLGIHNRVGDAIGTLGFVDELVALVACPLWGVLSDRVGVRNVATVGFALVGAGLWSVIACKDVIPGLFFARILFAAGGSATSTMVTAILPTLTHKVVTPPHKQLNGSHARTPTLTPSISSQITITPARFASDGTQRYRGSSPSATGPRGLQEREASTSQLAGLVGTFTGLGALLALGLFLPLPARFQKGGYTPSQAVANAFWIVGGIAVFVAIACFLGLAGLPGEDGKGIRRAWQWRASGQKEDDEAALASGFGAANTTTATTNATTTVLSYPTLLYTAVKLGVSDANIGLAYVGGLVARASSVGISLFIPFFVDQYFISSGRCKPGDLDLKHDCREAYLLAAALTGVSQFVALLCAPLFGWLGSRSQYRDSNLPLLLAAASGVVGNAAFARLRSPDFHQSGNGGVWAIVILIGISQIGAIVCSLALLGKGIQNTSKSITNTSNIEARSSDVGAAVDRDTIAEEGAPLLQHAEESSEEESRAHLKGSVAGVYSLSGGAGILILTKLGGWAADKDPGAPFIILAVFNGILLLAGVGVWVGKRIRR